MFEQAIADSESGAALEGRGEFEVNKTDIEGNFLRIFEPVPFFVERLRTARHEARLVGMAVPKLLLQPFGPGWALASGAGHRDPRSAG